MQPIKVITSYFYSMFLVLMAVHSVHPSLTDLFSPAFVLSDYNFHIELRL